MFDMLSPVGLPKLTLLSWLDTHTHTHEEGHTETETHTKMHLKKHGSGGLLFCLTLREYSVKQDATDYKPHVFGTFVV